MIYLDSSAIVKLLEQEAESDALRDYLIDSTGAATICDLGETEVRRMATRKGISQARATQVLDEFDIAHIERSIYAEAGLLPGLNPRSLDALHIAVALRIHADPFITYDMRQAEAAAACGLRVVTPA